MSFKLNDAQRLAGLVELVGHYQNGSDTIVKLFCDDATQTYHVKVGDVRFKSYYASDMRGAIDVAITASPEVLGVALDSAVDPYVDAQNFRALVQVMSLFHSDPESTAAIELGARMYNITPNRDTPISIDAVRKVLFAAMQDKLIEVPAC